MAGGKPRDVMATRGCEDSAGARGSGHRLQQPVNRAQVPEDRAPAPRSGAPADGAGPGRAGAPTTAEKGLRRADDTEFTAPAAARPGPARPPVPSAGRAGPRRAMAERGCPRAAPQGRAGAGGR